MKHLTLILSILALPTASALARGGASTGGGNAVVCRDANEAVSSAQLFDLHEGKVRYHYDVARDSDPLATLNRAWLRLESVDQELEYRVNMQLRLIMKNYDFFPEDEALEPTNDLGKNMAVPVPVGCHREAIGVYEDDGKLRMSPAVYRALGKAPTDLAAFFLHEAIYKLARDTLGQNDSKLTRQFVAALLSPSVSPEDLSALAKNVYKPSSTKPTLAKGAVKIVAESIYVDPSQKNSTDFTIRCYANGSGEKVSTIFSGSYTDRKEISLSTEKLSGECSTFVIWSRDGRGDELGHATVSEGKVTVLAGSSTLHAESWKMSNETSARGVELGLSVVQFDDVNGFPSAPALP